MEAKKCYTSKCEMFWYTLRMSYSPILNNIRLRADKGDLTDYALTGIK